MLSFSLENNQLYTTWHQMQSETSITCKATGIYFEKIIEDRIRQKFIGFTESTETFSSMERLEETEFNMFKNDFQITYDMAIDLLYDRIPIKEGLDPIEIDFHPRLIKVCMYDKTQNEACKRTLTDNR